MKSILFVMIFFVLADLYDPSPQRSTACLSAEESKLYDLVMEYRKEHKLESIPLS